MKYGALTLTAQERRNETTAQEKNDDDYARTEHGAPLLEPGGAFSASEKAPGAPWRKPCRLTRRSMRLTDGHTDG